MLSFNSRIKIISLDHKENQNEILQKFKGNDLQFRVECTNINTTLDEVFSSINLSNQLRDFIRKKVDEFKNKSDFSIGNPTDVKNTLLKFSLLKLGRSLNFKVLSNRRTIEIREKPRVW